MKNNSILITTDFNNDIIKNILKSNYKDKFSGVKLKNLNNILINIDQVLDVKKNFEYFFLITQIEKIYNLNKLLLLKENLRIKEIKSITSQLVQIILKLCSKYKKVIFFLWPQDTKDDYFGHLNFKKFGKNWLINYINSQIAYLSSHIENLHLIDPNFELLKKYKNIDVYDNKTKYLIDNIYSLDFLEFIAGEINTFVDKKKIKKIKLLILDLDNTLWGGEAGESNYKALELGPNSIKGLVYQDFQKRLKILKEMGFLLAICSKNDIKNVMKVFNFNKNMILKIGDFSAKKVNWKNKNENVNEILKELNLKAENTIFIDDTSFERSIVKSGVKDIQIFDFPENILLLNEKFNQLRGLEKNIISETDKNRTKLYLDEKKREVSKKKYFDKSEWLSSLKIKLKINKLKNLNRAEEMFQRTNQFNTSHSPVSSQKIKSLIKNKDKIFYEVEMEDKFGDYGIISVFAIKILKNKFFITDFLESCRVFQRNIEDFIIRNISKDKNFKKKEGFIFIKRNKKNIYVQNLFDKSKYLKRINNKCYKINKKYSFDEIKKIKVKIN